MLHVHLQRKDWIIPEWCVGVGEGLDGGDWVGRTAIKNKVIHYQSGLNKVSSVMGHDDMWPAMVLSAVLTGYCSH